MSNRNNGNGSLPNGDHHGGPSGLRRAIDGRSVASWKGRRKRKFIPRTRRQRLEAERRRFRREQESLSLDVMIKSEKENSTSFDPPEPVENLETKPSSGSLFAKWEDHE